MKFLFFFILVYPSTIFANQDFAFHIESIEYYELDQPMTYKWEKEQPRIKELSLVVLKTSEEIASPKQGFEEVIFFDDRVAERVQFLGNGRILLLVPKKVNMNSIVWIGPRVLPEQITAKMRRSSYMSKKASSKNMLSLNSKFSKSQWEKMKEVRKIDSAKSLYKLSKKLK